VKGGQARRSKESKGKGKRKKEEEKRAAVVISCSVFCRLPCSCKTFFRFSTW